MSRAQRFCAAVVVMVLASPALSRGAITWLTDTRTATLTHRTIQNNDSTFFDTLEFTASGPGDFSALNPSYTSSTLSHGSVAQNSSVTGGNHIFASGSFSSSDFLGNTTTQFDYGSSTVSFRFELTQSMIYTYTAAIGTTPTLARDVGRRSCFSRRRRTPRGRGRSCRASGRSPRPHPAALRRGQFSLARSRASRRTCC